MEKVTDRILEGKARPSDIDLINNVAKNMQGNTLCALADFAANPIIQTIKNFPEDFQKHVENAAPPANPDARKPDNAAARAATGKGKLEGRRYTVATGTPAGD
jgi:hypothetical protein